MDHAGGNLQLKKALPGVAVYGGLKDRVAGATFHCASFVRIVMVVACAAPTHLVVCVRVCWAGGNGDTIKLGETTISVIDAPCHTKVRWVELARVRSCLPSS